MDRSEFRYPAFSKNANIEFRWEDNVICIYGTPDALRRLANLMQYLADHPDEGHLHLDHWEGLHVTDESEEAAVAVFPLDQKSK